MENVAFLRQPIAKRIMHSYFQEAALSFLIGSTPWEIDEAMVLYGFDLGPFELQDIIGLDVIYKGINWRLCEPKKTPWMLIPKRMFELGKLGKKTGAGWYRYPGGGGKVDDPIVADLALEEAHFSGLERTDFEIHDIQDRLVTAFNQIGAEILSTETDCTVETLKALCAQYCGFPISKSLDFTKRT